MSSGFRPIHPKRTLFDRLSKLSRSPDEPFQTWTKPGSRFVALESWLYNGASEAYFSDEVLEAEKASQWLRSDPEALGDKSPVAGIKMLIIEDFSDRLDPMLESCDLTSKRSVIETALDVFGLSPAIVALFSLEANNPTNAELLRLHEPAKDRSATKYLALPYRTIAWTSTLESNFIYAIYRDEGRNRKPGSSLQALIQTHMSSLESPLLLPYLATYLAADQNSEFLLNDLVKMERVERKSGHHIWVERDDYPEKATMDDELAPLVKDACGLAAAAVFRKADANLTQIAARSIIQEYLTTEGAKCKPSRGVELYECLRVLEGVLTSQVASAEAIHQRALIQQTAIFQLTAQRDQGFNLEVAKNMHSVAVQSRRDTVSMEAIAFLTMLILPGAFIATFFAMPVFNWDSNDTLTPRFWLYWEITIPLTVLVIAIWRLWYIFKLRHRSKSNKTHVV